MSCGGDHLGPPIGMKIPNLVDDYPTIIYE